MDFGQIKKKLKPGDIDTAAQMIGIKNHNAYKAIEREGSKHHENIKRALEKIVRSREDLIESGI